MSSPSRLRLGVTLAAGMLAVSLGAVLVRFSQEAPSLVIAFYRVGISGLCFAPFYFTSRQSRPRWTTPWQLAAALGLGLHFAFWIASLRHTSVAVSVLLINTAPALVAPAAWWLFGERLTARGRVGLLLAFGGAGVLVASDFATAGSTRGALLALAAALALALYLLAGRKLRPRLDLVTYAFRTYLLAAALLVVLVTVAEQPLGGFTPTTWVFLVLLALVPQCLGHTSYNWALAYLPATLVSALILAEPILAPLWAWWLLGETPGLMVALGGVLVGSGLLAISCGGIEVPRTTNDE